VQLLACSHTPHVQHRHTAHRQGAVTSSALLCRCWGKQIGAAGKSHSVRFPWESPAMTDVWRKVGDAAQHRHAHILQTLPCWATCQPAVARKWLTSSHD
jgi:hypothetical protein